MKQLEKLEAKNYNGHEVIKQDKSFACIKVFHKQTYQPYGIKVFSWDVIENNIDEFKAAQKFKEIKHPNLVQVLDVKQHKDFGIYYIMEWWGESLRDKIKSAPPHPVWSMEIIKQMLNGLQELHKPKLVHRDINPNNIFIKDTEEGPVVKLGDYGLVKSKRWETQLSTGGTFLYMAPEMMPNVDKELKKQRDHRCDIYSAGAVLHELLTTQPPSGGQVNKNPPQGLFIPQPLWDIVRKSLDIQIDKRYQNVSDFIDDLKKCQKGTFVVTVMPEEYLKRPEVAELSEAITKSKKILRRKLAARRLLRDRLPPYKNRINSVTETLSQLEKELGQEHPKLIPVLDRLASAFMRNAEYLDAEKNLYRALEIARKSFDNDSPTMMDLLWHLGMVHSRAGDLDRAEARFKEALHLAEKIYPPNSLKIAEQKQNLAGVYYNKKDYQQSASYFNQALEIMDKNKISKSFFVYQAALHQLVDIYKKLGDSQKTKETQTILEEAQKARRGILM